MLATIQVCESTFPTANFMKTRYRLRLYFLFLGCKITADGDCSHEVKRHLLLRRKPITNLDSVLKSKDITLTTKVCVVKAMVFPVVMYRGESWTIRKAEHWRIDTFQLWCWRRLLSPLDSKEIKPVNPKGNQPWIFIGRTDAKAEASIHWPPDVNSRLFGKDPDLGKTEGQRRRGWQKMRWLDRIMNSMDMNLRKLWEIVKDGEAWYAAVHGVTKTQTWLSNGATITRWELSIWIGMYPNIKHTPDFEDLTWKKGWKAIINNFFYWLHNEMVILVGPKSSLKFFHNILQKNLNEIFGAPNIFNIMS